MDLQKQRKAIELMEKIDKKEKLIKKVEEAEVDYGINKEIYALTLKNAKQVVLDKLIAEKAKLEAEFAAL